MPTLLVISTHNYEVYVRPKLFPTLIVEKGAGKFMFRKFLVTRHGIMFPIGLVASLGHAGAVWMEYV